MPLKVSKSDLAKLLEAKATSIGADTIVDGVEFDSRNIKGGELFIALKGEKAHGHTFLDVAFKSGAALALVEDAGLLSTSPHRDRLICVPDTLKGFSRIALWWRQELGTPILAITGSVGKTTVKEMCGAILTATGPGSYSRKSFNNHIGVPYSLCQIGREHGWAVLEVGMNHAGEIRELVKLIQPNVAMIVSIAPAHIGFLGSLENIADAKFEIAEGLGVGGTLVLNGDDLELTAGLERAQRAGKVPAGIHVIKYGSSGDLRYESVAVRGLAGVAFSLAAGRESVAISAKFLGSYNALNACGAALAARTLIPALTLGQVKSALEAFEPPAMRLNVVTLADGSSAIDDSYNANPSSMKGALEVLSALIKEGRSGAAILGTMGELGTYSEHYHREVGKALRHSGVRYVIAVGEFTKFYLEELAGSGIEALNAPSPENAAALAVARKVDVLLVKGSRTVGLDRAVKQLSSPKGTG